MSALIKNKIYALRIPRSEISPIQKFILQAINNHDKTPFNKWPSYTKLANECSISERTFYRNIGDLVNKGWVEKIPLKIAHCKVPFALRVVKDKLLQPSNFIKGV